MVQRALITLRQATGSWVQSNYKLSLSSEVLQSHSEKTATAAIAHQTVCWLNFHPPPPHQASMLGSIQYIVYSTISAMEEGGQDKFLPVGSRPSSHGLDTITSWSLHVWTPSFATSWAYWSLHNLSADMAVSTWRQAMFASSCGGND